MLSRSYANWTATELRAFARKNGIKASLPKDELWELCYPVIVEQNEVEQRRIAREAEAKRLEEEKRLAVASADYEMHKEFIERKVADLNKRIDDCRAAITEWIDSLRTTSSLTYALRDTSRVLNNEFTIHAYTICVRMLGSKERSIA